MRTLIALIVVCVASAVLWASFDRPMNAPDWKGMMRGVSYEASHLYTEEQKDENVTDELIRRDLEQLSKVTKRVRTYTVRFGHERIPYIAKEFGMKVSLGIWLSGNRDLNEIELAKGIKAANDNPGVVDRIFVGNEVVLREELSIDEIDNYILRVRHGIQNKKVEIGTADIWGIWLKYPELAKHVDFVAIHLLPYWDGVPEERSVAYITETFEKVQKQFPGKKVIIGETGWPSEGRVKKGSVPTNAMEASFLRQFLTLATAKNYDYYVVEAFDQPWKAGQEGAVGAFWGIFDAEGNPKFNFTGHLSSFHQWATYAGIAATLTFALGLALFLAVPAMGMPGYMLLGGTVALVISGALFIVDASSMRYVDWSILAGVVVIVPSTLFTSALLITETSEWALSLWRRRRIAMHNAQPATPPRVSIHLPTHNEPALMVMQTLNALARLDYSNFEVIVLDNNTSDETMWKPVEAHCKTLGSHFRFYHYDNVKGFKAGALNIALDLTDPTAELIGVIDSDYQVSPEWLKTVIPGFADTKVAVVQAPQDYRDARESLFKALCYEEYTAFFRVGMVERNEHNAIIQHGTMCVIRRSALEQVGRWAEWCITEDTELGLRLFEAGFAAHYVPISMGRGLMPDTYDAYKSQRYRWVYGAMQIMKRHSPQIFGRHSTLTLAQRYHFVAGWLPWLADAFALVFGIMALVWSAAVAIAPKYFDVPLTALSGVALTLFLVKTIKTVWLHRAKVSSGFIGALAAAVTGLSLSHTVGRGVLAGIFTSSKPFLRTPKCEGTVPWTHAIRIAAAETAMLVGSIIAIVAVAIRSEVDDPAEVAWVAALVVLAVPYASALLVALGSTIRLRTRQAPAPDVAPGFPTPNMDMAA